MIVASAGNIKEPPTANIGVKIDSDERRTREHLEPPRLMANWTIRHLCTERLSGSDT